MLVGGGDDLGLMTSATFHTKVECVLNGSVKSLTETETRQKPKSGNQEHH